MIREKIDIHNTSKRYHQALESLKKDKTLSERNKLFIVQFLRDAELGKTVLKKQKKKIGKRACLKYFYLLKTSTHFLRKDFNKVTKNDMENFIYALEDDTILKKNRTPYTSETKKDIKVALKKFYKWLLGNNEDCPPIVKWLDTSTEQKDYIALPEKQIESVVDSAKSALDKAFVSVLFDLGVRIEEFLNVKKEDVIIEKQGYKIKILFSKTFTRTLPLDRSIDYLKKWLELHPKQDGQLFPLTYNQCSAKLKRLGGQTLSIPITPQMIRHSKATQLAQVGVGRYQMCEWMGWAMSSKMPDRYIRREGIDNQKTLEEIQRRRVTR